MAEDSRTTIPAAKDTAPEALITASSHDDGGAGASPARKGSASGSGAPDGHALHRQPQQQVGDHGSASLTGFVAPSSYLRPVSRAQASPRERLMTPLDKEQIEGLVSFS